MARLAGSDVERRRRSDRRASARTRDAAVTLPARQAEDVAAAAQLACLLEASAPKPGNVSPFASFRDATYEDFLASAAAIGPALLMAGEQDVAGTPTATLREAMALARGRDAIAREYATDFETTFEIGTPGLRRALSDGLAWREAVVEVYLALLAASPDTHIARKLGIDAAVRVQRSARAVLNVGGIRTMAGRDAVAALDRELRDEANTLNPGATADLTGAAIYVVLLEGGWRGRP